jgi:hypothetical protein
MGGEHKTERGVNMLRNLHRDIRSTSIRLGNTWKNCLVLYKSWHICFWKWPGNCSLPAYRGCIRKSLVNRSAVCRCRCCCYDNTRPGGNYSRLYWIPRGRLSGYSGCSAGNISTVLPVHYPPCPLF